MSLICHECKQDIEFGLPLRLATVKDPNSPYSAICPVCLDRVPEGVRLPVGDGLVVICDGKSTRNFTGAYTWSGMSLGKPIFSLAETDVATFLPAVAKDYLPGGSYSSTPPGNGKKTT